MRYVITLSLLLLVGQLMSQNNLPRLSTKSNENKVNRNVQKIMGKAFLTKDTAIIRKMIDSISNLYSKQEGKKKGLGFSPPVRSNFFELYGSANVGGGTDFLSTITSSGQLNVVVNPFSNFFINVGSNLLFANSDAKVKRDSVGLNSLMFPETGRFGVLGAMAYKIPINPYQPQERRHYLIPEASFAYRRVSIDSPTIGFKVLNYNLGLKYQFETQDDKNNEVTFSIMPYFHFFNIPDEDVSNFHALINDTVFQNENKRAEIKAVGVKTTVQLNTLLFFFDIRKNRSTQNFSDSNPFKGTIVNVGFSTYFKIRLKKREEENQD